ncbi:Stk1 family PASTA domain-containing Ser/Thr kinase [Phytoactinopolyspora halotolerans]|uniref:Stk1 family PASTA domain-containing Ser/Thr kinase n=1 Tax=Phytoactinopolyspora halotolerans TaxID=1981512 RepID=UPI001C203E2A|nr:Stk1 family PASTA domain-containing Ser/Thr kinase [Phytoactinopolyspora halotolerans]
MDLSVSDAPAGRLLDGRYRVDSLLARGGMATVYQATDTRLDRTVALKVMHAELAADDTFVDRFIAEARSAARLSDPSIVSVFDQGEDQGAVFLAMEFVQGRTLRAVLNDRGRLDPELSLDVIEPVLSALRAAHQAGIVHRDVKPENVLISNEGRVKVADFGLARPVRGPSNTTTRGLLLGTVSYISPEQALGERATPRSDVYAAGIVLYEMLTGQPPHTGPTDFVVVRAHIDEDVPPPSETAPVPRAVDELVARATSRDPARRYADAGSFLAAVRLARAALASGDSGGDETIAHTSAITPLRSRPITTEPSDGSVDGEGSNPFAVADAFYYDTGDGAAAHDSADDDTLLSPGSQRPGEDADSGAIDVANAFYHEGPPPPPPAQPTAAPGANRTRVIDPRPPEAGTGYAGTGYAGGQTQQREADEDEPGRAQRRSQTRNRRRRWRGPIMFLLVLLLAAAVTVAAWWFGAGRWTSTPSLLNLEPEAAAQAAEEAGLSVETNGEAFSERVEAGLVLQTDPAPGEQILRGGTISLTISQGPERYEVPDLSGMTREQIDEMLTDRSLQAEYSEEYSADVDKGTAISQNLEPGEEVRRETVIDVVISRGPKPIEIDDYTGRPADEAVQALKDAGFAVDSTEQFSDDAPAGTVISQEPRDGEGFAGDEISLVVSKGPEVVEVEVPQVVGERLKEAERMLKKAGLKVDVEETFPGGGRRDRDRWVVEQDPRGGTLPEGSTVTLYVL